jgi:diguanylate cyclase (GGDEF)-like protein
MVAVATRLRDGVRASDFVARTGGDEFLVVMPHTTLAQAASVIEAAMEPPPTVEIEGAPHPVTASWGVELFDPAAQSSIEQTLRVADEYLYEAKLGR